MDELSKNNLPGFVRRTVDKIQSEENVTRFTDMADRTIRLMVDKDFESGNEVIDAARGPIRFGLRILFVFFGIFGLWSAFAPLETAAVAPGSVVLNSNKKTIQHLEGGIISEILVHEGEFVQANQTLIKLDPTSAKARYDILVSQVRTLRANEIRLLAEREEKPTVDFTDPLFADRENPEVKSILYTQMQLFEGRNKAVEGQIGVLQQKANQSGEEIKGLEAQVRAARDQIAYLNEETQTVRALVEKGQALRPRLLALERQASELLGRQGEYQAAIARSKQTIAQSEVEILNVKTQRRNDVEKELHDVQTQLADFSERLKSAEDIKNRLDITAPQSGVVTSLAFHTKGGVIQPGVPIMEIVPKDDKLIVEAKVSLNDINIVHAGLPARIRLSAYKARRVPLIDGKVISVSADRITEKNPMPGQPPYYLARIEVDDEELKHRIHEHVELYPGMPADVLIVTGTRTLLSYLFTPLGDSMFKAFREK